jgi:hypothetical protein
MKLDVEGFELRVLAGAAGLLQRYNVRWRVASVCWCAAGVLPALSGKTHAHPPSLCSALTLTGVVRHVGM